MVTSVPAKRSMNALGSGWWRSGTAASRSAAAHPSVRRQSCPRSSAASSTPRASNIVAASSRVNARSAARIAVRLPSSRMRPTEMGGSARVTRISRRLGGVNRARRSMSSLTTSATSWKSSSTSVTGRSRPTIASTSAGRTTWTCTGSHGLTARAATASSPVARVSASSTARQKWRRSASSVSSDSQATGPGGVRSATQELTSALLPAPGGAAISVTGPWTPASSMSSRRGRAINARGVRGGENFVASSASAVARRGMPLSIMSRLGASMQFLDQWACAVDRLSRGGGREADHPVRVMSTGPRPP
jgi:hypothetical protein